MLSCKNLADGTSHDMQEAAVVNLYGYSRSEEVQPLELQACETVLAPPREQVNGGQVEHVYGVRGRASKNVVGVGWSCASVMHVLWRVKTLASGVARCR